MDAAYFKRRYGNEYPSAIVEKGVRMPLKHETRFLRLFEYKKSSVQISRLSDGSATITPEELPQWWQDASERERLDLCSACIFAAAQDQSHFAEILRFIMRSEDPTHWGCIAIPVALTLPQDEAFSLLLGALHKLKDDDTTANFTQGIAWTKHPRAENELRNHLDRLWQRPRLWDDKRFYAFKLWLNSTAYDATCCINHLIGLGVSPADFTEKVRQLSKHKCKRNRESCIMFLSKHYDWLLPETEA